MKKLTLTAIISSALVWFLATPVLAYVMQSTNYRIQFDSVNNGGSLGTSTNYRIQDTVGEIASGESTSTDYNLHAGYQQMENASEPSYISLTSPTGTVLAPAISGLSGGTATGTATFLLSTNNASGYSLKVVADNSPALISGGNSFSDYPLADTSTPDFDWSISNTSSAFGFSVFGDNVVQRFLDDGGDCNTGSGHTDGKCWSPFSTSEITLGQSASANTDNATTTMQFRAESGANHLQPAGTYTATLTITAYVN